MGSQSYAICHDDEDIADMKHLMSCWNLPLINIFSLLANDVVVFLIIAIMCTLIMNATGDSAHPQARPTFQRQESGVKSTPLWAHITIWKTTFNTSTTDLEKRTYVVVSSNF